MLTFHADDWGRTREDTDAILKCFQQGSVSGTSAMVFMEDSDRSAQLSKECHIPTGLHLNFTEPFSGNCDGELRKRLRRVSKFLNLHKFACVLYNPFLRSDFTSLYKEQIQEFIRLYGRPPHRIDGHRHMHLCANMLVASHIPAGTHVRRQQSFWPERKSLFNRTYRAFVDRLLANKYQMVDHFLELNHYIRPNRMQKVGELALRSAVEMMTHPSTSEEYQFLLSDECAGLLKVCSNGEAQIRPVGAI
jgi:chitin disaccharide deacetylase